MSKRDGVFRAAYRFRPPAAVFGAAIGLLGLIASGAVAEQPEMGAVRRDGGQIRLEWSGGTGTYQLEEAATLGGPWQRVGEASAERSAVLPIGYKERYFRVSSDGGDGVSAEEVSMRATLASVGAFVETVASGDRVAWQAEVLAYLRSHPDIDAAGPSEDGVWAITDDGVPLAIWNNRLPDPPGQDDLGLTMQRAGTELPGKDPARFASTVGAGFTQATPRLGGLLRGNGYATTNDDAGVETLKGTRPEPVLFFNTHGGICVVPQFGADGKPSRNAIGEILYVQSFGLWTGTKIDPRLTLVRYSHSEFVSELRAGTIGVALAIASYQTGSGGLQSPNFEWRFSITDQWVRKHMRFPAENHASIWLAVCRSGSPAAAPLRAAFRGAGAEMVASWTETVNGEAVVAATPFVFDRLLGANQVRPPATPQRPFDYEQVWSELRSRGLHRHPTTNNQGQAITTDLVYEGASGDGTFGLFAPSLSHVLVDEANQQMHLIGIFGNPPGGDRKVLVGGAEADVASWEPRKIICALDATGPRSAGDVQVIVRNHKSNVRQLSRWTLSGDYKMLESPGSPFRIDGSMSLIFRADVGEYRQAAGNVFIRPTRYALPATRSRVFLRASGTETESCGMGQFETVTWSGSGEFPVRDYRNPAPSGYHSVVGLSLNTIDRFGGLGVAFGNFNPNEGPLEFTYKPCDGAPVTFPIPPIPPGSLEEQQMIKSPTGEVGPDGSEFELALPGTSFLFASDWKIPATTMQNEVASFAWGAAVAEFPPDPDAAR